MAFFEKLKFALDKVGMVSGLLQKWTPRRCKTEKDYENSLYDFLHRELEGIQVTKQFAKGRIRADLVIGERVIVELKDNLDTTAKYQRLIGQLEEYQNWDGPVVIVLTGTTDPNLRKGLTAYVKKHRDILEDKFAVIEK
jgi:hypothetical protein